MISTEVTISKVFINTRASKNISGLVKVSVTSPSGLMIIFLMLSPEVIFVNMHCTFHHLPFKVLMPSK